MVHGYKSPTPFKVHVLYHMPSIFEYKKYDPLSLSFFSVCINISSWFTPAWFQINPAVLCHLRHTIIPHALTHWGRVTLICVGNLPIIGSDNGLSPDRRQAIIWTNAGILLIGPLGTNFSEISIKIITFSFKKMLSKVSSGKRRPSCLGLNVLRLWYMMLAWGICSTHQDLKTNIWHSII